MLNVMMINHYLSLPGEGRHQRTYLLSKFLAQKNCKVHLVGSNWHQLMYDKPSSSGVSRRYEDNLSVTKITAFKFVKASGLMRFLSWVTFALGTVLFFVFARNKKPDVVYYSSPSLFAALPAYMYARYLGANFVLEIRDLWPLTFVKLANYSCNHPLIWLMFKLEKFLCERADLVISNLQNVNVYFDDYRISYKKFAWIPNFTVPVNVAVSLSQAPNTLDSTFKIGYFGNIGYANKIDKLVLATKILNEKYDHNIEIYLYGAGENYDSISNLIDEIGIKNISLNQSVPKEKVFNLMQGMDCGIITSHSTDLYKYGTALNKLYDYLACGLPIIYDMGTNTYDPISVHDVGLSLNCASAEDLASAMFEMSKMPPNLYNRLRSNAKHAHVEHYNLEVNGEKLLKLLKSL